MSPPLEDAVMVVHGAEIFDAGDAARLHSLLRPRRLLVAGIMARVAAEESGLHCEFADAPPSTVLRGLEYPFFLANRGKTPDSGRIFGEIVAGRVGGDGIVHVECASGEVICWDRDPDDLAREIARATGYTIVPAISRRAATPPGVRVIRGCIPGEPVFVNGTVIGIATAPEVVLGTDGRGMLEPLAGIEVKGHGLEKLARAGPVDPATAWCKSGRIRSRGPVTAPRAARRGRVVFIDHCGHLVYRTIARDGVCGIVSVGDDTTAVCGHIGAHLGIPVFGIVDGDTDGIVPTRYAGGSVIAVADGISDDALGKEVAGLIPRGDVEWEEFVRALVERIGDRARILRPGSP